LQIPLSLFAFPGFNSLQV